MQDALICSPLRTPIGRYGGVFRGVPASDLASTVITALIDRTGVDPEVVDDVVLGQCYPSGEAPAIGRVAALDAGFSVAVPGLQLDRRCVDGGMLETAENVRAKYAISRESQDDLALASHRRTVAAHEQGLFTRELVTVSVPRRRGDPVVVGRDEHPRADTTAQALAELKPIRRTVDPQSTVTAGNASGQNDGAAVCLVTSPDAVRRDDLIPLLRLVSWGVAGVAGISLDTRSGRPVPGCWPPSPTNSTGARAATACRRCASVAARAWRPSGNASPDTNQQRPKGTPPWAAL